MATFHILWTTNLAHQPALFLTKSLVSEHLRTGLEWQSMAGVVKRVTGFIWLISQSITIQHLPLFVDFKGRAAQVMG